MTISKFIRALWPTKKINTKKSKEDGTVIASYKINLEGCGFDNIKVGDRFEGCACGHFFTDQVCTEINENGFILGTTTLVVFRACNIRPIHPDNQAPSIETSGAFNYLPIDKYAGL